MYLTLPDLGIDDQPIVLSSWLVKRGSAVAERESVVEVLCGGVTVDLPSPTVGVLKKKLVADGDVLTVGQPLAEIE
jgi:2-oxoglutarate dehydrogenase E2 component (dihydrolipoamide succinyltransferase)